MKVLRAQREGFFGEEWQKEMENRGKGKGCAAAPHIEMGRGEEGEYSTFPGGVWDEDEEGDLGGGKGKTESGEKGGKVDRWGDSMEEALAHNWTKNDNGEWVWEEEGEERMDDSAEGGNVAERWSHKGRGKHGKWEIKEGMAPEGAFEPLERESVYKGWTAEQFYDLGTKWVSWEEVRRMSWEAYEEMKKAMGWEMEEEVDEEVEHLLQQQTGKGYGEQTSESGRGEERGFGGKEEGDQIMDAEARKAGQKKREEVVTEQLKRLVVGHGSGSSVREGEEMDYKGKRGERHKSPPLRTGVRMGEEATPLGAQGKTPQRSPPLQTPMLQETRMEQQREVDALKWIPNTWLGEENNEKG